MSTSSSRRRPRADLDPAALAALPSAPLPDLRRQWRDLFGAEAPRCFRRDLLARAIGHRLQVDRFGDLPASLARVLDRVAAGESTRSGGERMVAPASRLTAGSRLLRTWRGETHEVEVLDGAYRWRGQTYRSLSVIAREITGARWNGPAFFGLRGKR